MFIHGIYRLRCWYKCLSIHVFMDVLGCVASMLMIYLTDLIVPSFLGRKRLVKPTSEVAHRNVLPGWYRWCFPHSFQVSNFYNLGLIVNIYTTRFVWKNNVLLLGFPDFLISFLWFPHICEKASLPWSLLIYRSLMILFMLPSCNLLHSYGTWPIYSWCSH